MSNFTMTTQKQVREGFYAFRGDTFNLPVIRSKRQNDQVTDVRVAFGEYVDNLERSGIISEQLADRVTL